MSGGIAYLANSCPETLEPYVWDEICELRHYGQRVVACSVKRPCEASNRDAGKETLYLLPLRVRFVIGATWGCMWQFRHIKEFLARIINGSEPFSKRLRAIAHTWLGAYLAAMLRGKQIRHIHVHHGYFSSWVGMVAAKILGAGFSLTLHGSDLLVRADYLHIKLKNCRFCVTVSDFNRRYILKTFPDVNAAKIFVNRLGIEISVWHPQVSTLTAENPLILTVGRLHPVKDHGFLIRACRVLKSRGVQFRCAIAGDGPERCRLQRLIESLDLRNEIQILGHVPREHLPKLYAKAEIVVLTSKSEGIPAVLMEAMAMEKLVLAPAITGIPELITDGESGFLYQAGSLDSFVNRVQFLLAGATSLDEVRHSARRQIEKKFDKSQNLKTFVEGFRKRLRPGPGITAAASEANEDSVLQQIQLPV